MVATTTNINENGSGGSSVTFDLGRKLRQRLNETNDERMRTQAKINLLSDQLQRMFSRTPKKPRETEEQMDSKIAKLEYQRTTHSLTLSDEKKLLRQIDQIKKSKKTLVEYHEHEHAIQEKKNELSDLRDTLRTVSAAIAELDNALAKVELAKRLGCTTSELEKRVVDCPVDKIGHVIGKNGSALKQLEQRTGVQVDVDKVGSKIHLQGSATALEAAVREVENITLAVEVDVELSSSVVAYLLSQRSAALTDLQNTHPMVHFDINRQTPTLHLRGRPEHVSAAKTHIQNLDVTTVTRKLSSRDTGLIVGKGGATINKLVSDHNVSINVSDNNASDNTGAVVEITGPESNATAALREIDGILYANEEIEDVVMVEAMQRHMFLNNGGAVLKEIQSSIASDGGKGGVLLLFEKRSRQEMESSKEPSKLIVKANRATMERALALVRERIEAHEKTIVSMKVSPDMIPAIIGKGGATINALRQEGEVEIEVDKETGTVKIQSESDEVKAKVVEAIGEIIAANQVIHVEIDKPMFGLIFGDVGREMKVKITEEMDIWLGVEPDERHLVLRGTQEKIDEAADMIRQFVSENFMVELEISTEDEPVLFHGGSDNILQKLEQKHNVVVNFRKSIQKVILRGNRENATAALAELTRFINGGDDFYVCKLKVPDASLGIVIGKGGSNLQKLEADFEGICVVILRSCNKLSIRGPEQAVKDCRSKVITLLATTRVTETIPIKHHHHELLTKPDVMRRITDGLGVQVTLADQSVKIRGISTDVKDAKALLMEQLAGTFVSTIDLEPHQLAKVAKADAVGGHFTRIGEATKAVIALDETAAAITMTGKRGNVKRAKNQTFGFLDFLLPGEFAKVKLAKPLFKSVGDPVGLAKIAADSGAVVVLDRELSCIQVRSSLQEEVERGVQLVNERISDCETRNYVLRLDPSEGWLLPKIIGRGGATVQALQSESGCSVDIHKDDFTVAISGETAEAVSAARVALDALIEQAKKECVFIDVPESAMSAFIGKSGANIKKLAEDNNVDIERLRKEPARIRVQGDEVTVQAGKLAIEKWLEEWESKNVGVKLSVEKSLIPVILGNRGANINAIQNESGCRIDIDRRESIVTIRGGDNAKRNAAMSQIKQIIQDEHDRNEAKRLEKEAKAEALAKEEAEKAAAAAAAKAEAEARAKSSNTFNSNMTSDVPKTEAQKAVNGDDFKPIDRSSEFAAKPVGLSTKENSALNKALENGKRGKKQKEVNGNKQSNKKKQESNNNNNNNTTPYASVASNSLLQMLVSDGRPPPPPTTTNNTTTTRRKVDTPSGTTEQWDTLSTVTASTDESTSETTAQAAAAAVAPKVYKSASGFSIRL